MKHVQACLSAKEGREINFVHRGFPATLVYACLCAVNPDNAV